MTNEEIIEKVLNCDDCALRLAYSDSTSCRRTCGYWWNISEALVMKANDMITRSLGAYCEQCGHCDKSDCEKLNDFRLKLMLND